MNFYVDNELGMTADEADAAVRAAMEAMEAGK